MKTFPKTNSHDTDILRLVKEMTSSEKAYYKKLVKRHADQNEALHLRLFKLMDESDAPDDCGWCSSLALENKTHFSGLKSYLQNDILDSLVFQKRNLSVDTRLCFYLEQIKILHEKNLLSQAQKYCKKAIDLASRYEKYHLLLLLIHLQNRTLEYKDYKQFKKSSDKIFLVLQNAIEAQKSFTDNRFMYEKVRRLCYRNWLPVTQSELRDVSNIRDGLAAIKPATSGHPLIHLLYLNTLSLCQYLLHEHDECSDTCSEILALWKTSHHLISEYPLLFLNSVNTACYNDFVINPIPVSEQNLFSYEALARTHLKTGIYQKQFEVIQFNTTLKIFLKTAQFHQAEMLMQSKSSLIFKDAAKILSPVDQLSVKGSLCISYFILEQWDRSERLLYEVKEKNIVIRREDILHFSLLFHLLILYEKKEWQRLGSALKAAYHLLYANKKLRPFERELMMFMGRLTAMRSRRAGIDLIAKFLPRLDDYRNDPVKNRYFLYFNYYGWLESKLMKIRYMDYLAIQAASHTTAEPSSAF